MEMDCYSEYKHHVHPNHQHYGTAAAANHPYYAGGYGQSSMRYAHAHSFGEGGQQPGYFDGYSRYNQLHHHHNHASYASGFGGHYGAARGENYHAGSEVGGQYYYQNAHQTSAGYYGNHSYESYRNASSSSSTSSSTSSGYQYNHFGGAGYHQTAPHPSQYYSSYNGSPTTSEHFNNRYYPTPPPSAPPTASQRDPYALVHSESSPYGGASQMDGEATEKLNSGRPSIDGDKRAVNDPIGVSLSSSPSSVKHSTENAEEETKDDVQQMKTEKSSSLSPPREFDEGDEKPSEAIKADEDLDSDEKEPKPIKHEHQHLQSTSLFNEHADHNQHQTNDEGLAKANPPEAPAASEAENSIATGKCEERKNTNFHETLFGERAKRRRRRNRKTLTPSIVSLRPRVGHVIKRFLVAIALSADGS